MNVLPCRSAMIAIMNCHTRDHHFYVEAVDREVAAFAAVIRGAELAAPVPTCPEWTLQDLVGNGEVLALDAPEAVWTIRFEPEGFVWSHDRPSTAAATMTGAAADHLLSIYGRGGDVTTSGDKAVLSRWRDNARI